MFNFFIFSSCIDISYDGPNGNVDRVYKNGSSSTADVISVIAKLKEMRYRFRIRYTIHKKNIETFVEDIEKIITFFRPERVITSVVTEQFDESDNMILKAGYNALLYKWSVNEIDIPVCDIFCESCKGCDIRRPNLHYYVGSEEHEKLDGSEIEFNHFNKKGK